MESYLTQHALKNIWCEPIQDRQAIIQPSRLTLNGGALKFANVAWEYVPTPDLPLSEPYRYFHIYHIGQLPPELLNITATVDTWINATGIMNSYNVMIDVVLANGAKVPLRNVFFRVCMNKEIIMALVHTPTYDFGTTISGEELVPATLDNTAISVRFYTNAWYDGSEFTTGLDAAIKPLDVVSTRIATTTDYQNFRQQAQTFFNAHNTHGAGVYSVDGFVVSQPGAFSPSFIGKYMTYVYDDSVKEVKFFPVTDLSVFTSTVDVGEEKYILFRDKTLAMIDYADDIDVYFIRRNADNSWKGVYVDRTNPADFRNLTHNCYSLRASLVQEVINFHEIWDNVYQVEVMLVVRQGGLKRGLTQQHTRIEELYKLTEEQIVGAMSGVNALLPEWLGAALEASPYVRIMGDSAAEVETDINGVAEAYGYNAATKIMDSNVIPVVTAGSVRQIPVPPALQIPHPLGGGKRDLWLYDGNGKMIGYLNQLGSNDIVPLPSSLAAAVTAEVFHGSNDVNDGTNMGVDVVNWDLKHFGFRCYVCAIDGTSHLPNFVWSDVTDTSGMFTYHPNGIGPSNVPAITWDYDALTTASLYPCVKIANVSHVYNVPLNLEDYPGFVRFSVNSNVLKWVSGPRTTGTQQTLIQYLQPGTLDVFMDGVPLIEDIDYFVVWPRIVVVKKPTRTPAQGLQVVVRTRGHCNPETMQRYKARETGFVKGGILSVNGVYDIRNDRNIRILNADALMRREQVRFAEDGVGPLVTDGRPYSISDYLNQVESYTEKQTVPFRKASLDIDAAVQGYLDERLTAPVPANPIIVGERWALYSPFCSALIHALNIGFLNAGQLDTEYDNLDIQGWVEPYNYLLDFDPCVQSIDLNYVSIAPHQYTTTMTLTSKQYTFMERVIQQFLGNKVDLTPYVQIVGS